MPFRAQAILLGEICVSVLFVRWTQRIRHQLPQLRQPERLVDISVEAVFFDLLRIHIS